MLDDYFKIIYKYRLHWVNEIGIFISSKRDSFKQGRNTMKNLVIKTASNIIYVANGKVSCVRCVKSGRFVAVKKFANIVNNLVIKAKDIVEAEKANNEFYYNAMTKLAMRSFKNMAKMATALLGNVRVYTSRNYCHDAFNHIVLSLYA